MKHARMDERLLVCAYYGPNGERLIRRGAKIADMLDCPLYILTVENRAEAELDEDRKQTLAAWKQLAEDLGAEEFIVVYDDKRPAYKVISDVARRKQITQILLGQTPKSRLQELAEDLAGGGSIVNALLRELSFVDLHIVSVGRELSEPKGEFYEKGVRAYLILDDDGDRFRLSFEHSQDVVMEGIFFKELGTDFNNGIFKYMRDGKACEVHVYEDFVERSALEA